MRTNNVVPLGNAQPKFNLNPKTQEWVKACKKSFSTELFQRFQDVLNHVDDALFALADKAESNVNQTLYFDAMREIRKHRKLVEKRFQSRWLSVYEGFWRSGTLPFVSKKKEDDSEFSLIEADDLEANLAIDSMVAKGYSRYKDELEPLNQRVSHMLHGAKIDNESNPFSPYMFCYVFHESSKDIPIDIKVKLVLGKLFERYLIAKMDESYQDLNDQLQKFGILPDLKNKKPRRIVKAEDGAIINRTDHAVDQQIQVELFKSLQSLLSDRRVESGLPGVSDGPSFDSTEVVNALSLMQHTSSNYENPESMLDMRALLLSEVQKLQTDNVNRSVGQNDSDTLDVINMIFEFILEDHNLPDAMKALLVRLQIPMLKVSMLDKGFFANKEHPARRLLNELAQAGLGWNPAEGQGPNTLFGKISYVVRRIIHDFDDQISLFDELLQEFSGYVEKETRFAQNAEKRTTQVTKGKEQLELAKLKAAEEIKERLSEYYIPDSINALVNEGWKDVLLLLHLRKGRESEEWNHAMQVLDDLIWSCQPKESAEERQKMLKLIPRLLKSIREGLTDISYDQYKMAKSLKDLQAYHIEVLRGNIEIPTLDAAQVVSEGKTPTDDSDDVEEIVIGEQVGADAVCQDKYFEQAKTIEIGTWMEYIDENDNTLRCKLSWKSDVTEKYVFVNRRGVKIADMTINGLASVLRRPTTNILETVPLMDRAMSAMMGALKGKEG